MPAQPPFQPAASFDTPLPLADELQFRQWAADNKVPFDAAKAGPSDYDMRGYWQALQRGQPMARPTEINPNDNRPHFTDYYKTPQHQSFSAGSQWAGPGAPNWINDTQLAAPSGRVLVDEQAQARAAELQRAAPSIANLAAMFQLGGANGR